MPNSQNRNNRRKREASSQTLIIPHITKDMLEKARTMAEHGASRAEIEQAIAQMQAEKNGTVVPPEPTAPEEPDVHRIIPTSRPRHTKEERQAMREQMRQEREQQEAARREEATRRTVRPAWNFPTPKPASKPTVSAPQPEPKAAQPEPTVTTPVSPVTPVTPVAPAPRKAEPVEEPTRTIEAVPPKPVHATETARAAEPAPQPAPRRQAGLLRSRSEAEAALNEKIRSDHIWLSNPVMVRGLGLAPVVGAALDGERALILCAACLLLVTLTRVLAVAVCHLSGNRFRPLIYCYAAAILYIPVYLLLYQIFGNDLTMLGIYLPILIAEPAIVKRMEFAELEPLRDALRHGFNNGLGMCVALLIVGCLRELLAAGTVFGHTVLQAALLPLAAQPAGGFVLVGVIAAVWCAIANVYTDYKREEVRRLYANRKH